MEDFEQEVPQEVKLIVTEEMRSYFYDMSKWARFLSVVGFVIAAFLTLGSFGIGAAVNANPNMLKQLGPLASIGATGVTIFYLLLALFFFYPSLLLFRFSAKGKQGILFGDQENLNDAISHLKSLFKFWGIITIVLVASYFLLLLAVVAGGGVK
ncbi:hypothetical protein ASE74_18010 [Pedobacter sp. Leaf216]|uniref:hypothetical protein n=1 Tax=Pedobacter sp. Leaf216 TaxID=1735684 RepID=UPI0006FF01D6|nr:hypothetical protein [Pedobacter sp. Leaf216]KQM77154.1 hypothetical protein ASE74_18010 [Pedobacter sp. Leaf216]